MRFLKVGPSGELTPTKNLIKPPAPYAILSHTWDADDDEVTFDDLEKKASLSKPGYAKLWFCANQARTDGLEYIWVDTCCINKANHAELSEAITSMFRWYVEADKCYVFLSDVSSRKRSLADTEHPWVSALRRSRWFTRGWTLQELLAPRQVEFYSREGGYLGDRKSLEQNIHDITDIPIEALRGSSLSAFKTEERMRWASERRTTKEEDQAYCLMGIFGVYMVPNYGEGRNAFERLKSKIADAFRTQLYGLEQPWAPSATGSPERRITESTPVVTDATSVQGRRRALLASMNFDQMDSRRSTIGNAYSTTCKWFLTNSAYADWIEPHNLPDHHGFLWINGKPGAGKSTLMKFAHGHAEKERLENEIVISFFFNARGSDLESSTAGMYRALLYQLLNQAADLQDVLDELDPQAWTTDTLCKLFFAAVAKLGQRQLKFFVDALDECDEEQIRDMVVFFEELGTSAAQSGTRLYMCFASRHYPTIDIQYGRQLILETEQGHGEDMAKYVQRYLRPGKGKFEGKFVEKIKTQILEKANGVFMWMVLVVPILNREFKDGRKFVVERRLQEIPPKLSDLFRDILLRDQVNKNEFLLCLQWILFAIRPLTREEFYSIMATGPDSQSGHITKWDPETITIDDMTRYVHASSKGLAELTKSKKPTVQFIHESVRDFLIKDNGLNELWPELGKNLRSVSHDQLKRCCQNYLNVDLSSHVPDNESLPKASSQSAKDLREALRTSFPFLDYASNHILHHAEEAVSCTTTQADFLKSFRLDNWLSITNILQQFEVRRHTPEAKLLYIFAEHNCPKLIRTLCCRSRVVGARGERYHYPLFAALANGHKDAVRALLSQDSSSLGEDIAVKLDYGQDFLVRKDQTPLLWALDKDFKALAEILLTFEDVGHSEVTNAGRDALSLASEKGYEAIINQLLVADGVKVDIEAIDNTRRTALHWASQNGQQEVVQLLVNKGANIEVIDNDGHTALHWASRNGQQEVVQLLVNKGANIEVIDNDGYTALHRASQNGQQEVVQLLVNKGANIEATDNAGRTALHRASQNGQQEMVQLLVNKGANIEATDNAGRTALHWASQNGQQEVVQLLVNKGANIEVIDNDGYTALHWASQNGQQGVVQLLVNKGANIEATDNAGRTALHRASQNGQQEVVQLLVNKGANIEVTDNTRYTALHWASLMGQQEVVQLLVNKGANIEATDNAGRTALHWASLVGQQEVVQLLVNKGANIEATDNDGCTALHWASLGEQQEVVQLLVNKGANIEATDNDGRTALH